MMKQKDAVYNAVKSVCAEHGINHEDGNKLDLTSDQVKQVVAIVTAGFEADKIELRSQQDDIKSYSNGLVRNWLRKDKRFNGGVTYQPKNPGIRTGNSDPLVKNLRILISTLPEGSEAKAAAEEKLDARLEEIKLERAKKQGKEIDMSVIPDDIKALLDS